MRAFADISIICILGNVLLLGTACAEPERSAAWHRTVAQLQRELNVGKVDICFVGDSLIEFWGYIGKPVWELEFNNLRCVNLGSSAERAEQILLRMQRADFSKALPDSFVVMAGTNNLGKEPPDQPDLVAKRVLEIVRCLHEQCPKSRILVLSILPSGREPGSALRKRIRATNTLLKEVESLAEISAQCQFLDVHDCFLNADGSWVQRFTIDGTHLSLDGYDRLARAIVPVLRRPASPGASKGVQRKAKRGSVFWAYSSEARAGFRLGHPLR